jgi:predicted thioesterase
MQEVAECLPGRRASISHVVKEADTALAMHSGDVAVLATPRVLAMAEQAAVTALEDCIESPNTTVGAWVELDHQAPTPVGHTVTVEAVLIGVHGRRLEFSISVTDGEREVARIKHRRVIVDKSRFAV